MSLAVASSLAIQPTSALTTLEVSLAVECSKQAGLEQPELAIQLKLVPFAAATYFAFLLHRLSLVLLYPLVVFQFLNCCPGSPKRTR